MAWARSSAALERRGQAKRTIVVVLADHGETLDENGHGEGHGDHLFGDEGTHIPFIVCDPRHPTRRRVDGIVRDVDLAPTLYDLTGVAPPTDLDGASLAPVLDGADLAPRLAYAETGLWFTEDVSGVDPALRLPYPGVAGMTEVDADHGDEVVLSREMRPLAIVAKHRMVRDGRYKLVYVPTRSGVRYFLYDTVADPGETHDVGEDHPSEVSRLEGEAVAMDARRPGHGGPRRLPRSARWRRGHDRGIRGSHHPGRSARCRAMRLGWLPSSVAAAVGMAGALCAWRAGGASDLRLAPPHRPGEIVARERREQAGRAAPRPRRWRCDSSKR